MSQFIPSITDLVFTLVAIIPALCVHEYAHGYVSYKLGDPSPKYDGRLSLNPLHHIDPMGALFLVIFKFGWAKPVQVNPRYYKKPKQGMALVALAGPVANFILALVCLIIANVIVKTTGGYVGEVVYYIYQFVYVSAIINVGLGMFNLLPFPPLDGSKVLALVLPDKAYFKLMQYEQYGFILLFLLLMIGSLDGPLYWLRQTMLDYLNFVANGLTSFIS